MHSKSLSKLLLSVLPVLGALSGCGTYQGTATAYLTWQIVDATAPDPLTAPARDCSTKNVQWVRVQLSTGQPFDFPCTAYSGETTGFTAGTYSVDVIALGPTGAAQSAQRVTKEFFGRTNLSHFIFQVR
ncbi:MAG: hypothetical protein JNM83_15345 [Myxococcales bacterium]|jgi:hypothetical protein|nr:hypothetical protein [Myxococcales bacterium]